MSDKNFVQSNSLFSLICERALNAEPDDLSFFKKSFTLLSGKEIDEFEKKECIKSWRRFLFFYISSGKKEIAAVELVPIALRSHDSEQRLLQFVQILLEDFKVKYKKVIDETISYDAKTCGNLTSIVIEKINEIANSAAEWILAPKKSRDSDEKRKYSSYHCRLRDNINEMICSFSDYFGSPAIFNYLIKLSGGSASVASAEARNAKIADLNISEVLSLGVTIADDGFSYMEHDAKKMIAIKFDLDYPAIQHPHYKSIIFVFVDKLACEAKDLSFVKHVVKYYALLNDSVEREFVSAIDSACNDILVSINRPFLVGENINTAYGLALKTLCEKLGASHAVFINVFDKGDFGSVAAYGFSDVQANLITNDICPVRSRIVKALSDYIEGGGASILEDIEREHSFIFTEIRKHYPKKFSDALIVPLETDEVIDGIIIMFSERRFAFDLKHERILSRLSERLRMCFFNALAYYKQLFDFSGFEARVDEIVSAEKIKLLAAISTGIAHNFNNLMAVILGRVGLLQRIVSDEKALASLKVIESTLKNGENIINRLQAFIPKKSASAGRQFEDLNKLLYEVVEIAKMRVQAENYLKNVAIRVNCDLSKLPEVFINYDEIHETLLNIAFNAVEAMPDGGDIYFKSYVEDSQVCISIKDTGIGMSREVQRKVFVPFFTTKGQIGTGLSLSYSYGVILKHQGNIAVKSAVNKGTELIVRLPVSFDPKDSVSHIEEVRKVNYKSKILIIDDNQSIRNALGDIIKTLGHEAYLASSGEEAYEILKKGVKFDFVFTDYKMPSTTGAQVAKYIKANHPNVFVIMITAYSYNIDEMDVENGAIDAIIGKPFNIGTIENTINAALEKKLMLNGK